MKKKAPPLPFGREIEFSKYLPINKQLISGERERQKTKEREREVSKYCLWSFNSNPSLQG